MFDTELKKALIVASFVMLQTMKVIAEDTEFDTLKRSKTSSKARSSRTSSNNSSGGGECNKDCSIALGVVFGVIGLVGLVYLAIKFCDCNRISQSFTGLFKRNNASRAEQRRVAEFVQPI